MKARLHPADETEAAGAKPLLQALADQLPRLTLIWVDGGYKRAFAEWVATEAWMYLAMSNVILRRLAR